MDIPKLQLQLKEGMQVLLDDDEGLAVNGTIKYSIEENIWVAEIDWNKFNANSKE